MPIRANGIKSTKSINKNLSIGIDLYEKLYEKISGISKPAANSFNFLSIKLR